MNRGHSRPAEIALALALKAGAGNRPMIEVFITVARIHAWERDQRGGVTNVRIRTIGVLLGLDPTVSHREVERAKCYVEGCKRAESGGARLGCKRAKSRYVVNGEFGPKLVTA